jgi:nitrite reductase (NO-forming)
LHDEHSAYKAAPKGAHGLCICLARYLLLLVLLLLLLLLLHRPAPASKPPASAAVPAADHPNALLPATPSAAALRHNAAGLPVISAPKSKAPAVPPPCNRDYAVHAVLELETTTVTLPVSPLHKYTWWTFDGSVPGPLVRCRVGDTLEVRYTNK